MSNGPGSSPESDFRFRRLIENSAIATALAGSEGRFLLVNRAMCDMLGYDADTLLQKTWADVTDPRFLAGSAEAQLSELLPNRGLQFHRM